MNAQDEGDDASRAERARRRPEDSAAGMARTRRRGHEIREARDLKPREEEPIPNGVGRDLLRDQRGGGEWCDEVRSRGHETLVLSSWATMRARMVCASSDRVAVHASSQPREIGFGPDGHTKGCQVCEGISRSRQLEIVKSHLKTLERRTYPDCVQRAGRHRLRGLGGVA